MTEEQARKLVGNQSTHMLRNMIRALSLHPWLNTIDDQRRLEAAKFLLKLRAR